MSRKKSGGGATKKSGVKTTRNSLQGSAGPVGYTSRLETTRRPKSSATKKKR
jgi:hypothetical protein